MCAPAHSGSEIQSYYRMYRGDNSIQGLFSPFFFPLPPTHLTEFKRKMWLRRSKRVIRLFPPSLCLRLYSNANTQALSCGDFAILPFPPPPLLLGGETLCWFNWTTRSTRRVGETVHLLLLFPPLFPFLLALTQQSVRREQ